MRFVKDFDQKLWFALSLEEAATTFPSGATGACSGSALSGTTNSIAGVGTAASAVPIAVSPTVNAICAATASGAGFSQYGQPYSLNHLPDIIGKVAYEANIADRDIHLEAMGLYKDLYDASADAIAGVSIPGNISTHDVAGYGFGGGVLVPIIPKLLDFQGSAMAGRGIGRYGAGLLADSTINSTARCGRSAKLSAWAASPCTQRPNSISTRSAASRARIAPTALSAAQPPPQPISANGAPNALNSGCTIVNAPAATCAGQTETLWQVTGGVWDKVYKGPFGEVRIGLQYSFTQRDLFTTQYTGALVAGSGQTLAQEHAVYSPKVNENTVMTSLRYYPFQ